MINLLSTERKGEIRAARTNVILLRYITIVALALLFILGFMYVSYMTLEQTKTSADQRIAANTSSPSSVALEQQTAELTAKINAAKIALSQQESYAKILTTLGQAMPKGTYLEGFKLSQAEIIGGQPVTLIAHAESSSEGALIQQQLQVSGLFIQISTKSTEPSTGDVSGAVKLTLTGVLNRGSI